VPRGVRFGVRLAASIQFLVAARWPLLLQPFVAQAVFNIDVARDLRLLIDHDAAIALHGGNSARRHATYQRVRALR
jgi:hypothetical protein